MSKGATEREDEYKRQVAMYLDTIAAAFGWSQSEIARKAGVTSTTINKALKRKHVLGYPKLLTLEAVSDLKLPTELTNAARALSTPLVAGTADIEQIIIKLEKQLAPDASPEDREAFRRELRRLATGAA